MKYPWFKTFRSKTYYKEKLPNIIKSNKMTMGDYCKKLEKELKKILKVKYVVLTTSGTSALMMATSAGYVDVVTQLLDHGAQRELKDNNGKSAIDFASERKNKELILLLK